jgi:thiol-disulfide isomerase/thioredoxin
MYPLEPGATAPAIEGVSFADEPTLLWFYKVTCPVCQMAAPKAQVLAASYPVPSHAIGQDPPPKLGAFGREFGMDIEPVPDLPPYDVSNAYGIRVVPTLFVVEPGGEISDMVESWDREGYNRVSKDLAARLGTEYVEVSRPGDGLPSFRPG